MADDKNATGAAGGAEIIEEKPLLDAGGDAGAADDSVGAAGADDAGVIDKGVAEPDWRDRIAELGGFKDDAREMAWLKRFASEANYHKAIPKLRRDFSAGKAQPALTEGATPEEIAAHRKALGIPETPDGYGLSFPETMQAGDGDKAALSAFQEYMHNAHVAPSAAKAAFSFYVKSMEAARVAQTDATQEAKIQNLTELKSEWKGREFDRNIRVTRDWLAKAFEDDEDVLDAMLAAKMPDGVTRVGDHAKILKRLSAMALEQADDAALIAGDVGGSGKSREDRKNELLDKSSARKLTKAEDAELNKLFELQVAEDNRAGRSRVRA